MVECITAWQCIGCGRIEGPQQCIGICEDRRQELVYADDYRAAVAELASIREEMKALAALASQIAHTTPRPGECERTWGALQARARRLLGAQSAPPSPRCRD